MHAQNFGSAATSFALYFAHVSLVDTYGIQNPSKQHTTNIINHIQLALCSVVNKRTILMLQTAITLSTVHLQNKLLEETCDTLTNL
jgi:hypothetical protein